MLYPKNVPNIERVLRILAGVVLIALALTSPSVMPVFLSIFVAGFVIITGFVGWCPACALVGRKIKKASSKE